MFLGEQGGGVVAGWGAGETRSVPYWAHAGAEPSGAAQGQGWADATKVVVPPLTAKRGSRPSYPLYPLPYPTSQRNPFPRGQAENGAGFWI